MSVQHETVLGSVLNRGHVVITTVPPEPPETLEVTERRSDLLSLQVTKAVQNARVELGSIRSLLPWKTDTRVAATEAPGQTLEVPECGSHLLGLKIPEAVQGVNVERRTVSSDYLSASRRQRGEDIRAFPESRLKTRRVVRARELFRNVGSHAQQEQRRLPQPREARLPGAGWSRKSLYSRWLRCGCARFLAGVLPFRRRSPDRNHRMQVSFGATMSIQKACALSVYDVIAERTGNCRLQREPPSS